MDTLDRLRTLDCAEQSLNNALECYQSMTMLGKKIENLIEEVEIEREYIIETELPTIEPLPVFVGVLRKA